MESIDVDLFRHFSLQIKTLKVFGMWFYIPHSKRSVRFWAEIMMRIVLGLAVFTIPTGTQFIYVVKLIMRGNAEIQEVVGIINLVMTELLASIWLLDMFLRRDTLVQLANQLMSEEFQFRTNPQRNILENAVKTSRKLFWFLIVGVTADIVVHVIVVPGLQKFKVLPLDMDLIWIDVNKEEYFNYVFAYQVLYKPMMLSVFVAIQTILWASMSFTISQLDILIYNFENMKESIKVTMAEKHCDANIAFNEIFKRYVLHHCAIIRFVNTLQSAFGGQLSLVLCFSGAIIGTTAVQIFSVESPMNNLTDVTWILAYLSIFIMNLFIVCYFGDTITVKSLQVSTVAFACPWVDLPTSSKKNLVLFIAKTQQPIIVTASNFVPISLETFTTVMNWTYKGFAVMNQMKK